MLNIETGQKGTRGGARKEGKKGYNKGEKERKERKDIKRRQDERTAYSIKVWHTRRRERTDRRKKYRNIRC